MQAQVGSKTEDSEGGVVPIDDVPLNLESDGSNYIEWTWSLLDEGIEPSDQSPFSALRAPDGQPLLTDHAATYLDEQMLVASKAALDNGHRMADVILCCKSPNIDSGAIADELIKQFFRDRTVAVARATALGQICDIAEDFNVQCAASENESCHR
jgi:hypothetical protein